MVEGERGQVALRRSKPRGLGRSYGPLRPAPAHSQISLRDGLAFR